MAGNKQIQTTTDLFRYRAAMRVDCTACGAAATMRGFDALALFGNVSLAAAEKRLRCKRCGGKSARLKVLPPLLARR